MTDIWSFLLQTLTASGVAVLLLIVKAMFRDKLSPRWQFAVWSVLAISLLLPAGLNGRYTLVNWPFTVEIAKSVFTGEYGTLTRVTFPIPMPVLAFPGTAAGWLYFLYLAGVVFFLFRYALSYIKLCLALRQGKSAEMTQIRAVAEQYHLSSCPAVEVEGLPSAFICGILRPTLALPAGTAVDDKVILHELLHHRYRDVAWGLLICLFRCLHWCNPLLWYCANQAENDLESLCDQRVLERLEGEERRDYGRILLSMADEKYARAPGTSSMANGSKNIKRRIEAIVRFKRYPSGMALVSVCIILVLTFPLITGTQAQAVNRTPDIKSFSLAAARTTWCTTCDGALDTYAKAVLERNVLYRAMCAPLTEQNALASAYQQSDTDATASGSWNDTGLPLADPDFGYRIYNLTPAGDNAYEGVLVVALLEQPAREKDTAGIAFQSLRAEKQHGRWVVLPEEDFHTTTVHALDMDLDFDYGLGILSNLDLPAWDYEAETENFTVQMKLRTSSYINHLLENDDWFFSAYSFDTTPQPGGTFETSYYECLYAIYTGAPDAKTQYTYIGGSSCPLRAGEIRPFLVNPGIGDGAGSSTDGNSWGAGRFDSASDSPYFLADNLVYVDETFTLPDSYAANLYLNGQLAAELTLLPTEGGSTHD